MKFTKQQTFIGLLWVLSACAGDPTVTSASADVGSDVDTAAVQEGAAAVQENAASQEKTSVQDNGEKLAGEQLNTHIPEGWAIATSSKTANLHIAEYVPADTVDEWQQKLSIEAMGGDYLPDPLEFVSGWAQDQAEVCDHFRDNPIFAGFENGYATVVRLLECGQNKRTRKPLVTMIKVIRGEETLYTITRIWRLETFDEESKQIVMDTQALAAWSNHLKTTVVCEPGNPEHPCPVVANQSD